MPVSKECDTLNCGTNCEGPGLTGTLVPANAAALRIATLLPTPTHAPLGRQCSSPCWQVSPASKHVACDRQLLQHSTYAILLVLTSAPCVFMFSAVCVCVCTADCACCSMGNPHATFFAEDCEKVPLDAVGHDLEHHSSLPPHLRSPPRMPAEGAWVGRPLNTCASAPWQSKRRCGAASCAHAAHHGRAFDSLPLSLRSCACCVCVCVWEGLCGWLGSSFFPERCNVSVVTVAKDKKSIRMRVWERGTGITEACGTGACGTAVNAVRRGYIGKEQVRLSARLRPCVLLSVSPCLSLCLSLCPCMLCSSVRRACSSCPPSRWLFRWPLPPSLSFFPCLLHDLRGL